MIGCQCGRVAQKRAARAFIRLTHFSQLFQWRMLEPMTQVAERILVRHQIYSKLSAAGVEPSDLRAGDRSPILPHGPVIGISEGMLRVELNLVDLKIGEMINQPKEGFQLRHPASRNVQHHSAPRKVWIVTDG